MRGRVGCMRGLIPVALAGLLIAAPAATAKSSRGLVFPQGPLTASWKSLEVGKRVMACNGGRTPAELDVRLSGFKFKHTDSQSEETTGYGPGKVLKVTAPERINPGRCSHLEVELVSPAPAVDPGEYPGTVVAAAVGLGVVRQQLTVAGPGTVTKPAPVAGAVDAQQLEAENDFPTRDLGLESPDLLLDPGKDPDALTLGEDCGKRKGGWTKECSFIGNLYKGDDVIAVHIAGPIETGQEGVAKLPIRIEGSGAVGDYEGVLDPAGNGAEKEEVTVKLSLTDSVCWAILALLLGAVLASFVKLWAGRWRLDWKLKDRAKSLPARYATACAGADVGLNAEKVDEYKEEVLEAVRRYRRSTLILDVASEAYKEIDGSLAVAEEDLRLLEDGGFGTARLGFEAGVAKVEDVLNDHRLRHVPELLTRARALLEDLEFGVADATAWTKQAKELGAALDAWLSLARRILADEALLLEIAVSEGRDPDLRQLIVLVKALREELFGAVGATDLERLRASGRFEDLHSRIAFHAEQLGVEEAERPPVAVLATLSAEGPTSLLRSSYSVQPYKGMQLSDASGTTDSEPAKAVELPPAKLRLVFFDVLALVLAAAATIVAGLEAFYFGKTWGTGEDYLLVIVGGAAAQLVVTTVFEHFSAFMHDLTPGANRTPPKLIVKPASATD